MENLPIAFIAAAASMTIGQLSKIFAPVLKGKAPVLKNALKSGGMPSAHTAACASMAFTIGLREGLGSSAFAVGAVLTALVAHDAIKVRGTLNSIINILRKTVDSELIENEGGLPDTLGHSLTEVVWGFVLAAVVSPVCHFLLP